MNKGYRWNPDSMTRVFALPADVDKHMRLAGALRGLPETSQVTLF